MFPSDYTKTGMIISSCTIICLPSFNKTALKRCTSIEQRAYRKLVSLASVRPEAGDRIPPLHDYGQGQALKQDRSLCEKLTVFSLWQSLPIGKQVCNSSTTV